MKIVKVTYTTKTEYAEQNSEKHKKVMADLQTLNHQGINYNACLSADGKTFIHTAFSNRMMTRNCSMNCLHLNFFKTNLN